MLVAVLTASCSVFADFSQLTSAGGDAGIGGGNGADAAITDAAAPKSDGSAGGGSEAGASGGCVESGDPDLVGYYPLDETSGDVVHDCSGNGNDGKVISVAARGAWGPGHFGGGFVTDGTSGCIDLGTPASLLLEGGPFTVAAWANANTFGAGAALPTRHIVGRSNEPNVAGWRLGTDLPDDWGLKAHDMMFGAIFLKSTAQTSQWTHVAIAVGGGQVRLYVSGIQAGQPGPLGKLVADDMATVRIGCKGTNEEYFDGTIDEVRFYKRQLSDTEMDALAHKTK